MTKKIKTQEEAPTIMVVIDKVLYDLLAAGKINQVLTWKELKEKPEIIYVRSNVGDDEPIQLRVKHMDVVGFGYLPKGYPAIYQANKKTTRFHVLPIDSEEENPESAIDGTAIENQE